MTVPLCQSWRASCETGRSREFHDKLGETLLRVSLTMGKHLPMGCRGAHSSHVCFSIWADKFTEEKIHPGLSDVETQHVALQVSEPQSTGHQEGV